LVIDIQRGGPSTGLPTKTEAADLNLAIYGRHAEAPLPVVAAYSPSHCFIVAIEAARIALKYRTPVILLSDGYIANGSEPWKLPRIEDLPDLRRDFATDPEGFHPYVRDPATLARVWAIPGTPGLEHRIGGLEKEDVTGNVSYEPANHEHMVHLRAEKVERIAQDIPEVVVHGDPDGGDLLVLGWGSTLGAITGAVNLARKDGLSVSRAHLRYLNPFPRDLGEVLRRYKKVFVPELNLGQLSRLIRAEFLVDAKSYNRVAGIPFRAAELEQEILELMDK